MTCPHTRWRLDSPNGRTVKGICKQCGAKRSWPASPSRSMRSTYNLKSVAGKAAQQAVTKDLTVLKHELERSET